MVMNNEQILTWLNNIYAMEISIAETLEGQVNDAKDFPEVQTKLQEHMELTQSQAARIKDRVEALGGSVSRVKSGIASMMGKTQGAVMHVMEDKVVRNAIMDYAVENYEIASYRALRTAAEVLDDHMTVELCDEIEAEEVAMAQWLEMQLPQLTKHVVEEKYADRAMA